MTMNLIEIYFLHTLAICVDKFSLRLASTIPLGKVAVSVFSDPEGTVGLYQRLAISSIPGSLSYREIKESLGSRLW